MTKLKGSIKVPGDKSISHRSIMLGSIAKGKTHVRGFLSGADCLSTIGCFRAMGIAIEHDGAHVSINGNGMHGLKAPDGILDCGNSGTTTRLISGILAAQSFTTTLTGDDSIKKRPMGRIIKPLSLMGADIKSINANDCAPLCITGSKLHGIDYISPVASAQVKSAILLAGLYASSKTSVTEPYLSRNHTELMLKDFGVDVTSTNATCTVTPANELYGCDINVPGDISSAAYFLAAALMLPGSDIIIKNVGINPTRDGIIKVARLMGANIEYINQYTSSAENSADIHVSFSQLHGITIEGAVIPTLIDELPIIAAMATSAEGTTIIKDASELKVKESNRIRVMTDELTKMGAVVTETDDGMIIEGGHKLYGAAIDSHNDHRIAMTFSILSLLADGTTAIHNKECVDISYPRFFEDLKDLITD